MSTWLYGIANNECRRVARASRCMPVTIELDPGMAGAASHETNAIDRSVLQAALDRLSDEHREVVLLHEVEGLSYEEAAQVLQIPVGTVKSRLHHAFLSLRRALDPLGERP